jgi:hypothetical protein
MIYKVWGGDGRTTLEGLVSGITGKSGSSGKSGMDWKMSEKDQDGLGDDQERLSSLLSY